MIIGGLLLLGVGIGMAAGDAGAGALIGLGAGLVLQYLVDKGMIGNKKSGSGD